MTEIFKRFNEVYSFSNYGRVMNHIKNKERKLVVDSRGYNQVQLNINGNKKNLLVHRVVAYLFIPNPYNKPEVNHLDGDKTNNMVFNLEWVTRSENQHHRFYKLKIGVCAVDQFDEKMNFIKSHPSIISASRSVNTSFGNITNSIRTGYMAAGYYWKKQY